ncbi:MAG TPA: hypothetical protein VLB84_15215, partial [Bacteroidia bacterium]|nr:hypothetical protein [Bacteroidia bacterium]
ASPPRDPKERCDGPCPLPRPRRRLQSLHNGGGVGWGEVINGGFGMVLDGSADSERRLKSMLFWDVNNGIARRGWARNEEALFAIKREMERTPELKVTLPNLVNDDILNGLF